MGKTITLRFDRDLDRWVGDDGYVWRPGLPAGKDPPRQTDDIFIHPTATVHPMAVLGFGAKVWHYTHVEERAVLGQHVMIGQNCYVAKGVKIADGVRIQNGVSIYDGVMLDCHVFVGPNVTFTNDPAPRAGSRADWLPTTTRVEPGASIGANATILCGIKIGAFAMVGAGSVVTHDVAAHALVVGNPARAVGHVCQKGHRVEPFSLQQNRRHWCARCGVWLQFDKAGIAREAPIGS